MALPEKTLALPAQPIKIGRVIREALRFVCAKPLGAAGAFLVLAVGLAALAAPLAAPYDPSAHHLADKLQGPSLRYWMGTDQFGRDILSRVLYGARVSLIVGFLSVLVGGGAGGVLGLTSGYLMGKFDLVAQRVVDVLMSFPMLILALVIVAVLGPSTVNIVAAIALVFAPRVARVTRAAALSVRSRQYVDLARASGATTMRILVWHMAPNCLAPWLVIVSAELGAAILTESSLSFLGLGTQEPNASLGAMLSGAAQAYIQQAPWMAVWPGLMISLAVFGFNVLGDALRDVLDPRLRRA